MRSRPGNVIFTRQRYQKEFLPAGIQFYDSFNFQATESEHVGGPSDTHMFPLVISTLESLSYLA